MRVGGIVQTTRREMEKTDITGREHGIQQGVEEEKE